MYNVTTPRDDMTALQDYKTTRGLVDCRHHHSQMRAPALRYRPLVEEEAHWQLPHDQSRP